MAMTRMRNELKQLTTITLGAQLWFIELANTNSPDAAVCRVVVRARVARQHFNRVAESRGRGDAYRQR